LLNEREPSAEFSRLREASGLSEPYIVVQAIAGLDTFVNFVKKYSQFLGNFRFLALPIGPVLDDNEGRLGMDLPGLVRLATWPHPLLLAELIANATAVVGHSYHLAITALAFGVPVFSSADLTVGKYTSLSHFETIYSLPNEIDTDPHLFITRLGRTRPTAAARAARDQLAQHWDRVAAVLNNGSTITQSAVCRFLQSLPSLLESVAKAQRADLHEQVKKQATTIAELESRNATLGKLLGLSRAGIAARDDRIANLLKSPSWKVTTPFRFVMRNLKRLVGK
jgi:lipopolysaccharide transport system ATP-binding protein